MKSTNTEGNFDRNRTPGARATAEPLLRPSAHAGDVRVSSRTGPGDEEGSMRSSSGVSGPARATGSESKTIGRTWTWVLGRASGNVRGMTRTGLSGTWALGSMVESRSGKKTMRESLDNDNTTTQSQFRARAGRRERRPLVWRRWLPRQGKCPLLRRRHHASATQL